MEHSPTLKGRAFNQLITGSIDFPNIIGFDVYAFLYLVCTG
ncbi:hypothetical protein M2364_001811 [Acinetobacter johnsonii]|nr:hypothetical protein [Acinetobacter johnsonii]